MSQSREADIKVEALKLKEMFPEHSIQLIESILRKNKGVVDSAISSLLTTPPDSKQSHPPTYPNSQSQQESFISQNQYQPPPPNYYDQNNSSINQNIQMNQNNHPQLYPNFVPNNNSSNTNISLHNNNNYNPNNSNSNSININNVHNNNNNQNNANNNPRDEVVQTHVFPLEFLRWPKDSEVVRVNKDGTKVVINSEHHTKKSFKKIKIDPSCDGVKLRPVKPVAEWNEFKRMFASH
ncbi:hypothetical protein TRFO_42932 [Tritrichomonas foetus]|uniref:CUE domain-containing protein n=1 Tax=Tritrichomonas foetus TaxID=1144522 RepID=A0A1J4KYL7_9EUKA|nr:hypothetical protein TRFO_42932 [Tritrichomonas foetus]|eukprot:OHT14653.1 hypothetical protein TRFO_42932 [Tritrichomonas foetus]